MPSNFVLFRHTALPSFRAGNQIIIYQTNFVEISALQAADFWEELTFIDNNLITK